MAKEQRKRVEKTDAEKQPPAEMLQNLDFIMKLEMMEMMVDLDLDKKIQAKEKK